MNLVAIISGGQSGADQAALRAAKTLGLKTGGWAPNGWRTDAGPAPWLELAFGLRAHESPFYPPRTRANVAAADGTLIFGRADSPGCRLTASVCADMSRPCLTIWWPPELVVVSEVENTTAANAKRNAFIQWLLNNRIRILNVAGNRESRNPGVGAALEDFLIKSLSSMSSTTLEGT
jgi:hypothetical protein